jgi:hypothetical protein
MEALTNVFVKFVSETLLELTNDFLQISEIHTPYSTYITAGVLN